MGRTRRSAQSTSRQQVGPGSFVAAQQMGCWAAPWLSDRVCVIGVGLVSRPWLPHSQQEALSASPVPSHFLSHPP